jgi:chorismate mutase
MMTLDECMARIGVLNESIVDLACERRIYPANLGAYVDMPRRFFADGGYCDVWVEPVYVPFIEKLCEPGESRVLGPDFFRADLALEKAVMERILIGKDVTAAKEPKGLPMEDGQREMDVLAHVCAYAGRKGLDEGRIRGAFEFIMDWNKQVQRAYRKCLSTSSITIMERSARDCDREFAKRALMVHAELHLGVTDWMHDSRYAIAEEYDESERPPRWRIRLVSFE